MEMIGSIAETPVKLRLAIIGLSREQLDTRYRPEGWTVRQTVHHLADSHLNGYVRFKLALTETEPEIKTYEEKLWAEFEDGRNAEPSISLALLESLHQRWVMMLRSLKPEDFARTVRHPEWGVLRLDAMLGLYEWHGRHHTTHITGLRQRMGW
jgi:hypothetical protein